MRVPGSDGLSWLCAGCGGGPRAGRRRKNLRPGGPGPSSKVAGGTLWGTDGRGVSLSFSAPAGSGGPRTRWNRKPGDRFGPRVSFLAAPFRCPGQPTLRGAPSPQNLARPPGPWSRDSGRVISLSRADQFPGSWSQWVASVCGLRMAHETVGLGQVWPSRRAGDPAARARDCVFEVSLQRSRRFRRP